MKRKLRKNLNRYAKKLVADIFEDIMDEIPLASGSDDLDEEVDREMDISMEVDDQEDINPILDALKKKFNIQTDSTNLEDILKEVDKKREDSYEHKTLLSQLERGFTPTKRYQIVVQYPEFDESGMPFFTEKDIIEQTLSVSNDDLEELKDQESQNFLKILSVDERFAQPK